ncbi:hypothetical protein WJ970_30110 [Achromobacter xylosoxidans]
MARDDIADRAQRLGGQHLAQRLRGLAQLGLVVRHDAVGLRVIAQRLPLFLVQGRQGDRSAGGGLAAALQQRDESGARLGLAIAAGAQQQRQRRDQAYQAYTQPSHAYPPIPHAEPGNPRRQQWRMASCLAAPPATLRDTNYPEAPTHRRRQAEFVAIEAI